MQMLLLTTGGDRTLGFDTENQGRKTCTSTLPPGLKALCLLDSTTKPTVKSQHQNQNQVAWPSMFKHTQGIWFGQFASLQYCTNTHITN